MSNSIKRYHVEKGAIIDGNYILDGSVPADKLKPSAIKFIIPLYILTTTQSRTADTYGRLNGGFTWKPTEWNLELITNIDIVIVCESAGAGSIKVSDDSGTLDLGIELDIPGTYPHATARATVTDTFKDLEDATNLAVWAKGDGSNAITVHQVYLIVQIST